MLDQIISKTINLKFGETQNKKEEILDYFLKTFDLYSSLFECLASDEAYYKKPNRLRHPLIFYYAHTAVFFINKLNASGFSQKRVDPHMESIMAIGVDEMSWDDLDDNNYDWPLVREVQYYRQEVRSFIIDFIENSDLSLPIKEESPLWIIMMGIEHERIHLETSSVLIREHDLSLVKDHALWGKICEDDPNISDNEFLQVSGGSVHLGLDEDYPYYYWDNEIGQYSQEVKDFKVSKFLVSNKEFLNFIEDGGYENSDYWSEEGLSWLKFSQSKMPRFWNQKEGKYFYRSMLKEVPMPWSWPVDANYHESKAFCEWKSKKTGLDIRLPIEAEWMLIRLRCEANSIDWDKAPGNINLEYYMSSSPVNRFCFGRIYDLIGNVWQWMENTIDGYPGFRVHPVYDDFSTPTFDGKHNLIKGGSWISTGNLSLARSRYAFRKHFFQHAGFRYVEGESFVEKKENLIEVDDSICEVLHQNYSCSNNIYTKLVDKLKPILEKNKIKKIADLGCTAGRASLEMAPLVDSVKAYDLSARLFLAPVALQKEKIPRYTIKRDGELHDYFSIEGQQFSFSSAINKVQFSQCDPGNLGIDNDFDLVMSFMFLERIQNPKSFLEKIHKNLSSEGFLAIASSYHWSCPKEEQPGGFKDKAGENFSSQEGIQLALSKEFELIGSFDALDWEYSTHFQTEIKKKVFFSLWKRK